MAEQPRDYGKEAVERHRETRGKVSIASKMKVETLDDLSIAYTPGVATVCMAIHADISESYHLTNRANTVAVVTDGSAVLGLGNIGPEAAMPVMEGKSILFKGLADIDAFPICLATQDSDIIIQTVRALAPSFGGINLEDIAAPRCFDIEDALQDLGIPVFHDDQHGTAIAVLAGVMNALLVTGRKIEDTRFVFAGAGAGGIASAKLLMEQGATNVTLVDSVGIISRDRTGLTAVKSAMLDTTNPDNLSGGIADAMRGADVFIGLAAADTVSAQMVTSMAKDPIVFAMANPIPEIWPDVAKAAGAAVVGTGRSDFPNQVNNSLVFPGVFRGALDSHATRVTTRMKLAAATALAALVAEPTPENVLPWSLDRNVAVTVAQAVSGAV
ncbi:MAG: NAD-dependent malic enzyme [Chloroflexi bacterium]|jgi:malate dehydrogenase (oxaloacetate-decarboxylating)|uniref:Putative Malic enzyme, NAD binding domain protein n=1 Tax=uncultured marine microorganism HF4000_APKG5H11 TaxID=455550 RepID=B3T8J0_9ZZZZ|nr:putative Malic enzyme, NAD binding domain protein [uncultured marine microorganism HF4000_APKG5H11]MCH2512679.1 NADP-dependent malic enzyme [Dehalococcoidia bacterium]PKB82325.1 MAG: NAD-dependent malic enzyme [SAR202 cluster bacterium MP-SInd-SRR3963457-G1]PKB84064.1 MAG: NAD-dependent malic enzyme [SAR202 cluster bacterium MP-NPac-SRR3961935-G1]RUA23224.1 MAG: NAD-dependent malic enzyme [Chloroflexota bacterium]|tara:strand:+ start:248 stop:1402 length:1155 start_codon:yes stop_codon:yes gene_type:complete